MEVLFATPTFDKHVSVDFLMGMAETARLLTATGVAFQMHVVAGNNFVDIARNKAVHHFLHNTECTDILFIDSDEGWDHKTIPRVLSHDEDIVCGLPPKKCDPPCFHSNAMTGVVRNGLFQSKEGGTGFMRIRRGVFAKIDAAYSLLAEYDPENKEIPYFQTGFRPGNGEFGITKRGFLGEDMFFSRLWSGMGEHFWIDSDITFTHRGSKAWSGNFYDHCVDSGMLRTQ